MELNCPSCDTRYQVPDGAIGEVGRRVSCSNCGHTWHARVPSDPEDPAESFERSKPLFRSQRSSVGPPADAPDATVAENDGPGHPPPPSTSRTEQLAEIRKMLAEVQSEARPTGATDPIETTAERLPEQVAIAPPPDDPVGTDAGAQEVQQPAYYNDPLREQIEDQLTAKGASPAHAKSGDDRPTTSGKSSRIVGSSAFFAGCLFILILAALLAGLYLLKPEIVAQLPQTEQAMDQYVGTVDNMARAVSNTISDLTD